MLGDIYFSSRFIKHRNCSFHHTLNTQCSTPVLQRSLFLVRSRRSEHWELNAVRLLYALFQLEVPKTLDEVSVLKLSSCNLELNETSTFSKADPCFNNPINSYSQLFIQQSNCIELILVSQENAGWSCFNYIHKVTKTTGNCVQDNCAEVPFGCSNAGNTGILCLE
jgi:hypothetical protein